ncbi:zinc transporter ZIP13-like [Sycon ciliatum]|uniref:zinc transporter ZIP13-like n=1 Tax=Sycon ciliatum TaxID=27933 RepID=UPI0020A8F666|eukprot:scpid68170/ scgid20810/ Zinc transporter ZIP13; Solute carrier family 39 member 13; Zrt- and Irt-like protein 13
MRRQAMGDTGSRQVNSPTLPAAVNISWRGFVGRSAVACLLALVLVMANCSVCADAHTGVGGLHAPSFPQEVQDMESVPLSTWCLALCGALIVGSTGVLPLLFIPSNSAFKNGLAPRKLNVLLSLAVGGLLGDVFLHLLPETRAQMHALSASGGAHDHTVDTKIGLLVIAGMVVFLVAEKIMVVYSEQEDDGEDANPDGSEAQSQRPAHVGLEPANGTSDAVALPSGSGSPSSLHRRPVHGMTNGSTAPVMRPAVEAATRVIQPVPGEREPESKITPAGYLNLFANIVDNFTHGLAVSASFLAGHKVGMLTTFAIIIHEVPHEVGDFAILLNSGFSRWSAAKAQVSTASGALVGATFGLLLRNAGESVLWVLPFTAGGFLYIALVSVMPTLLAERNAKQSVLQVLAMAAGILAMQVMDLGAAHS